MAINFAGYVFKDNGGVVNGATVELLETGTTTVEASTTTDSNGYWAFSEADQDRYDVKITSGTSVRYIRWNDEISLKEIDVRNNENNTTPAATFTNLTNNASNQVAVFSGANTTRADGDVIYLSYKLANSAGELTEFARMIVEAEDTHDGSEDGAIQFQVMRDGTLATVWEIKSTGDGDVDAPAMSFDLNMDSLTIGNGADTDISLTFDANTSDGVITWMEDEDYFKFSDEIFMNSTEKILFGDTATFIHQSSDGVMTIDGEATIDLNASTAVLVSNDLKLNSDSAVLGFGVDNDTTLTHTDGTGLTLNSTNKLTFGDTGTFIHQSSDGVLTITSDTTVDINGAVVFDGALTGITNITLSGTLSDGNYTFDTSGNVSGLGTVSSGTITTSGNIELGHASDTTLARSSSGDVTIEGNAIYRAGGTDVPVSDGGTGASSLTDGGVLLGSGTNAVTAMAVLADGEMIVGDGTTDPVAESGATLRTSIGVGTGDSPQFTAIELGHASDTTIARSSSGAITVEGTQVLLAGAQTGITTITNASLVVGRDADNDIDFTTDNNIRFRAGGEDQLTLTDGALTPSSNAIVDLGTDALEFKDAYFDGTLEADTITIGGTNIVTGEVITTLGTITAGTWEGTTVAVDQGGTGATTLNNLITLGTHTTGNYVATITGGTGITSTGATSGEGIAHSLSVDAAQTHITSVGTLGALQVDNLNLNGNTFSSTNSDGDITISGNDGGSTVVAQHIDMSGGGITVFGGGTASAADTNTKIYTANAGPINVIGTSATDTTIAIGRWSNNASGGTLAFIKDRDGTIGDATALADGDELGKIWFGAGDGVQNAYTYTLKTAQFSAYSDGATGNDGSGDPQTPSGFKWETNTGVAAASTAEVMRLDKNGALFLGDTANGNIATQGLTINQGDNSTDEVIALKATNVAHGRTTYGETDTFASFKQRTGDSGGLRITSFTDADTTTDSLNLTTYRRGQPNDLGTAAVSDYGAVDVFVTCHNGSNSAAVVDDDKALFSVTRRTSSGIDAAFIVNSTGELHTDAATGLTTDVFDKEDDVMLVRAFDLARDKESDKKTLVKSGWDKFAHKFEDRLVELGILGKKINEGGMLNLTRLLFLHNGAIFQEFEKRQVLEDKVKTLEEKLQAIGG